MNPEQQPPESGDSSNPESAPVRQPHPADRQPGEPTEPGAGSPAASVPPETSAPTPRPAVPADTQLDAQTAREIEMMMADVSAEDLAHVYQPPPPVADRDREGIQKCKVVAISGDDIFVDAGPKNQGVVPRQQFGENPPQVGQYVELILDYYDADSGLLVMSRENAVKAANWATLERGAVVEGRVTGMNKGGLEVDLKGIRAFMPASHVDVHRIHDISTLIGERVTCVVTEVDRKDQNVLVSRRKYLEKEQAEVREKTFASLNEGDTVTGKVARIADFGAFIDLGGVDGLLHIKDLSYGRVEKVADVVKVGDLVEVKVLRVDSKKQRISLGLKQARPDPWLDVEQKYSPGMRIKVRATKLVQFGAFAEVEEGVEGLIPLSEMSRIKRVMKPSEVLHTGDIVEVQILKVDAKERRISLSIKELEEDPWAGAVEHFPAQGTVKGKVTRTTDFGAFVELKPGVEGLVHISELSENRVRSVGEVVSAGQEVEVRVLGVDPEKRRISLSMKPALEETLAARNDSLGMAKPRKRKKPLRGGLSWEGIGDLGDLRGLGGHR
jgi:small subunit ribosomal protein S1